MFKNVFSKKGIWTTLSSIVAIVLMILVGTGIIGADEGEQLKLAWQNFIDAIPGGQWTAITLAVLAGVQQIVLLFVKDPGPDELPPADPNKPIKEGKNGSGK